MSTKIIKQKEPQKESYIFLNKISGVFVFVVGCIFPLAVYNKYYRILDFKYYFYCMCVIALAACFAADAWKRCQLKNSSRISEKKAWKTFDIMDKSLLIFLIIALISTLTSKYIFESFWGNEGRYTGLFLLSLYGIAYFCVSRFWKFKSWYVDSILVAALLVCIFGITDYFSMDILHFQEGMMEEQMSMFTSTLGNINTYTTYVGMFCGIAMVLFVTVENWKRRIFYYFCLIVGFFAAIMGRSDNIYLSLAALFGLSPLILFGKKYGLRRYCLCVITFLTVLLCIHRINITMPERVLGTFGAANVIMSFGKLPYIAAALWAAMGFWYLKDHAVSLKRASKTIDLRIAWLCLTICVIAGIVYVLYDCNVNGNVERYAAFENYVLLNDDWGTNRGYIWRNAMECFDSFPFWHKLVGYGPDTFGIVLLKKTEANIYHQIFDSAHNEYLHFLITVGIAGLSAYLVFLSSFIIKCVRKGSGKPYTLALMFGAVCYMSQALVNINLPITAPFFWLFIAMGAAAVKQEENHKGSF